ncbi:FlgO family outer membrane protein [Paraglaciecola sp. L3A3]|uniref:FlgO family outer membrane protein n=1 Tax=Paraglaciecola sp. L3A3 TaxID=2686358 RepID=UPI00131C20F7|nr:FlgO family outer membrane protein [Paraglaciecola sp. L3A3]
MLKLTRLITISLLSTLSACSSLGLTQKTDERLCADDLGTFHTCQDMKIPTEIADSPAKEHSRSLHFNILSEYTEQMAAELKNDVRGMEVVQSIVVASFVHLDSSLQNTDTLGIQLAEAFINDLQQIGLPVADHKVMGVLDVNDKGDFVFSRNMEQFYNPVDIGYVLAGTMQKNSRGLIVNARIINFTTNKVVASSSKFLPNIITNNLL